MTTHDVVDRSGPWRRFVSQGPLDVTLWLLIAASSLFLLIRTDWSLLRISVWSVPFLLLATAASTPWRTVRWRTVLGFFAFGMGPVFLVAALVGWGLDVLGIEDALQRWMFTTDLGLTSVSADLIAPVTEEFLKVFPLLIYVWWRKSGLRSSGGPLDFAVIAGATGAGLAFAEDIFVYLSQGSVGAPASTAFGLGLGRFYAGLAGAGSGGFSFTGRSDFADNVSFFFPETQELLGVVWIGHGALAMGIGLSLGLALWWSRLHKSNVYFLIPVAVFTWAVWEHIMANWYGGSGCSREATSPLCALATVDLRGRILPVLILMGLGCAGWVSSRQLRALRSNDPVLLLPWSEVHTRSYTSRGPRGWASLIKDRFDFLRWRRNVGFGAFHLAFTDHNSRGQVTSLMASRVKTLTLKEQLTGSPPSALSSETAAAVDWLAPAP